MRMGCASPSPPLQTCLDIMTLLPSRFMLSIECSLRRFIRRPEHYIDTHCGISRQTENHIHSVFTWSVNQSVLCHRMLHELLLCSVLCLYDSCKSMSNQPALFKVTVNVKLSLYRPWRPLGLREVEAPTVSDIRFIDGGKVVSPTRRPLFTPRKILGTHFC
jgi:hypothetical protein